MKTEVNLKNIITNLLIVLVVFTTSSELIAQEKKSIDLKNFKIVMEKTASGIKMQSIEGSAWVDLTFDINNDKPQAINEYGMTTLNKVSSKKNSNFANFLFTITKTKKGIVLKGIKGTAWAKLSFSFADNEKQVFNQFGMTKLN